MLASRILRLITIHAENDSRQALRMTLPRTSTLPITPARVHSPAAADKTANAQYRILRIYLKGASTEVPDMANVARQAISPHVGVDMQTLANPAGPGAMECVLRIALHARLDGKTIFLIEVSVAGVFELDINNMEDAQRFVRKIAPSVLFPFARRDLASLTVAAGFQPVLLDHIDFDGRYTVTSTNPAQAREILSSARMQQMINFHSKLNTDISFSFVGGYCYVGYPVEKPLFAAGKDPGDEANIKEHFMNMLTFLSFIDKLVLDEMQ